MADSSSQKRQRQQQEDQVDRMELGEDAARISQESLHNRVDLNPVEAGAADNEGILHPFNDDQIDNEGQPNKLGLFTASLEEPPFVTTRFFGQSDMKKRNTFQVQYTCQVNLYILLLFMTSNLIYPCLVYNIVGNHHR